MVLHRQPQKPVVSVEHLWTLGGSVSWLAFGLFAASVDLTSSRHLSFSDLEF